MNEKGAAAFPAPSAATSTTAAAGELLSNPFSGSPAIPCTTERRHPSERIRPGDSVRDMSEGQRTGVVKSTAGFWAYVQWNDGPSETMAFGYLERIPGDLAT
jgi:hypothetical protein